MSSIVSLKHKPPRPVTPGFAAPSAGDSAPDLLVRRRPGTETQSVRSELSFVASELQQALEAAQSEADWHRQALQRAENRAKNLRRHLTPITESLGPVLESAPDLASASPESLLDASRVESSSRRSYEGSAIELEALCPASQATLRIYCLGPFRVWHGGRWVDEWPSLRGQAILRYLAAHRPSPVSRDLLMDTFWPAADAESARRNLHQAIYSLRLAFREESAGEGGKSKNGSPAPVLFENGHYALNPELQIWIDWEEFEQRIQAARRALVGGLPVDAALEFSFAMELYRGDLLEEANYEDWAVARRAHLRNLFLEAANWLSGYFYELREFASAIAASARMLELDRCNEPAHCRLIECFREQGLRAAAIRQYHTCRQALRDELGVSPAAETQALFKELLRETGNSDAAAPSMTMQARA